jgi:gas vesicle protein
MIMNAVRYWAVFSLGVAAGAAAALIYAPQTGEKTRKQLKRHLEDASDYLKDTTDDLSKHASRVYKSTIDAAGDVASRQFGGRQCQLCSRQHPGQGRRPGLAF